MFTTVTTIAALGLTGASSRGCSLRIAKFASVGILPLVIAFAVILAMKSIDVPA